MMEVGESSGNMDARSRPVDLKIYNQALILTLPTELTIDILARLPIRTIIACKNVCRTWHELLSSSEFVKYHLSRSTGGLFIHLRPLGGTICRLVEFDSKLDLQHHAVHHKPVSDFDLRSVIRDLHARIAVVALADGLLCLHDCYGHVDTLYVCNPVTREYIMLPYLRGHRRYPNTVCYGMGISALSCQYKVVRVFHKPVHEKGTSSRLNKLTVQCMVYTLGTGSWRSIPSGIPYEYVKSQFCTVMNGNLHWLVNDANNITLVSCLNLETELFKSFSLPSARNYSFNPALTALGESLCFCEHLSWDKMIIWRMKEYGVGEWTKEYVINEFLNLSGEIFINVHPLKVFNNGDVLMFYNMDFLFYYCNKTKTTREIEVFEPGSDCWHEVHLHTSSFLSLKSFTMENVQSF